MDETKTANSQLNPGNNTWLLKHVAQGLSASAVGQRLGDVQNTLNGPWLTGMVCHGGEIRGCCRMTGRQWLHLA